MPCPEIPAPVYIQAGEEIQARISCMFILILVRKTDPTSREGNR